MPEGKSGADDQRGGRESILFLHESTHGSSMQGHPEWSSPAIAVPDRGSDNRCAHGKHYGPGLRGQSYDCRCYNSAV